MVLPRASILTAAGRTISVFDLLDNDDRTLFFSRAANGSPAPAQSGRPVSRRKTIAEIAGDVREPCGGVGTA